METITTTHTTPRAIQNNRRVNNRMRDINTNKRFKNINVIIRCTVVLQFLIRNPDYNRNIIIYTFDVFFVLMTCTNREVYELC